MHVIDTPIAINFASFRKCVVVFVGVGVVDVFVTLVADLGADLEVDLHMCVGVQMFVGVHIGVHIWVCIWMPLFFLLAETQQSERFALVVTTG